MLSNNTASNVRENLFVPSIKYVWARQGSHVGATAHQAELLQRPSNDDNCVWVKWATGEEECISETQLVEMPSKRQRKRPALINEISTVNQTIKIQKREATFMASCQKYSIGTSVSKVFYDEDKEKGVNREFSGVIKAYDAEEGLYLIT